MTTERKVAHASAAVYRAMMTRRGDEPMTVERNATRVRICIPESDGPFTLELTTDEARQLCRQLIAVGLER